MNVLSMILMSMLIISIMLILSKNLKEKKTKKKENSSNFECGFEFQTSKNIMISGQFFMIAILFIIFDLEITLLIPFMKSETMTEMKQWNMKMILIILIMGTILEWKMGMLEWSK